MSTIFLNNDVLVKKLQQVAHKLNNPLPLTQDLARVLLSQTQQNFHFNGRPAWAGLSTRTLEMYRKQGYVPKGLLQRSPDGLKNSIQFDFDHHSASVSAGSGKSKDYAAIHQFGGMAGRNRKVKIPARPYLPIDQDGNLQAEAELAVEATAQHYLNKLFD